MAKYKEKIAELLKSPILKDGLTLISGNVWAQGIVFAAYLLLTRLFSPTDFGFYNIFCSYIDVLVIVSTCRYELAIVLSKDNREAVSVSHLALRINGYTSLFVLVAIVLLSLFNPFEDVERFSIFTTSSPIFIIALLIPITVYLSGTSRVYTMMLNRQRNFRQIALSDVIGSSAGVLARLLMGLPRFLSTLIHTIGLPLGVTLGRLAGNVNLRLQYRRLAGAERSSHEERGRVARKYRNFPLYTMPKEFINSLSHNLPFLWLAFYFDKAEVGLFALALTFTFRPVNILNSAIEKLLYIRVTERVRDRQPIKRDLLRLLLILNVVAVPFFVAAFFVAEPLFGFLFGGRWSGCGHYVRWLLPWVFVMLSSSSLMFLTNVFSRQRTELFFSLLLFVLRIAAMIIGLLTLNFTIAIALFSISGAAVSLAIVVWLVRLVGKYEKTVATV